MWSAHVWVNKNPFNCSALDIWARVKADDDNYWCGDLQMMAPSDVLNWSPEEADVLQKWGYRPSRNNQQLMLSPRSSRSWLSLSSEKTSQKHNTAGSSKSSSSCCMPLQKWQSTLLSEWKDKVIIAYEAVSLGLKEELLLNQNQNPSK